MRSSGPLYEPNRVLTVILTLLGLSLVVGVSACGLLGGVFLFVSSHLSQAGFVCVCVQSFGVSPV